MICGLPLTVMKTNGNIMQSVKEIVATLYGYSSVVKTSQLNATADVGWQMD